ncbi:MAG: lipoate--protein ligase family protein [Leucobacter sp.]|nr:lipoate--protein ligase family protein [Leucobacter sp.]
MTTHHGEYKVAGGKLVIVDFAVTHDGGASGAGASGASGASASVHGGGGQGQNDGGVIANFRLSGDFFLEPDDALPLINHAVNGLSTSASVAEISTAIQSALPEGAHLIGFSTEAVGVAVRRALTGAAQWDDYSWTILHEPPMSPMMNAALDEVLTTAVGEGRRGPTLRVWEWDEDAVIIGSFQSVMNEVDETQLAESGAQLVRRISGGGAMYMQPANSITYALYAPEELVRGMTFADSYAFLDDWVLEALRSLGIEATYKPLNDITSPLGKIGGAAQKRLANGAVLHHATLAYDIDAEAMTRVLRIGREKLSDKGTTSAAKRVDPLRSQTGMSRETIIERMIEVFQGRYGGARDQVTADELAAAEQLVATKFSTEQWIRRVP